VALSSGREKNFEECAQLQIIAYKTPPKGFKKLHNSVSVSTKGDTAYRFWHYLYELDSFCGTL